MTKAAPQADDIVKGLAWDGEDLAAGAPNGIVLLQKVVDAILAAPTKADRMMALSTFYQDSPTWGAVVDAYVHQSSVVEAVVLLLRGCDGMTAPAEDLVKKLKSAAQRAKVVDLHGRPVGNIDAVQVRDAIEWDDYPKGVVVPPGWELSRQGLWRLRIVDGQHDAFPICSQPVVVTRRLMDLDTKDQVLEVAWLDRGRWQKELVGRAQCMDARSIVALATRGFPVASTTSKYIVAWIKALDEQDALPREWTSTHMGWVGTKGKYFLWGRIQLHNDGPPPSPPQNRVDLHVDEGAAQLAESFQSRGTWDGWKNTVATFVGYPSPWVAVYAGVASVLLHPLNAPSFVMDWAGKAGCGKTTSLAAMTSCFADPREGYGFRTWTASLTGLERTAAELCDLPLCLDEGQRVPKKMHEEAGSWLYMLANGTGKQRATVRGQQRIGRWRTILGSTSEVGITLWSPHEGVRARVIVLRGAPLGKNNAALSEQIRAGLNENYGHALPRVVQFLLTHPARLEELKTAYTARVEHFGSTATNQMARRMAQYVATLECAAAILHNELGVPEPDVDVIDWLWQQVHAHTGESDRAQAALEFVWEFACAHQNQFFGRHAGVTPFSGLAGVWSDDEMWTWFGFFPSMLKKILTDQGYEYDAMLAQWADRDWLVRNGAHRTFRARVGKGGVVPIVAIRRKVALPDEEADILPESP